MVVSWSNLSPKGQVIVGVAAVCSSAAIAVWMWKRSKKSSHCSSSKEGRNQDSDEIKAKPQHLEKTKEELDNEVYKIIMFLCQRRLLENHRELFKLQLEDVEREREDNKEKIQSVEKLITESEREKATETTEELLREKQKLLSAQWKLERKKEDLEKLQLNTEKVLQCEEADGLLTRMTEKKQNLEKKEEGM
ncbi:chromosome partition protein Smc-like [Acanthopagrus latus]|uniref:chromosome partition protein Smc-like n=1 Tax=Acanthopagrus latus TaxID=8177 RepID=UPI00187CFF3F|nr:chromosome partition protein Smc-like [Acanthopagrus latus]